MGFPSKVRHSVDADPKVVLRNLSDGAETASAVETAVSLDTLKTAYWHNNEIPNQTFAVVVRVTAIDVAGGDETYNLQVQVDTDEAFAGANFEVVAAIPIEKTGVFVINLDGPTIKTILSGAAFIRTAVVIDDGAGNTASITYEAWLAPVINQG